MHTLGPSVVLTESLKDWGRRGFEKVSDNTLLPFLEDALGWASWKQLSSSSVCFKEAQLLSQTTHLNEVTTEGVDGVSQVLTSLLDVELGVVTVGSISALVTNEMKYEEEKRKGKGG